jgi:hypothetical protein
MQDLFGIKKMLKKSALVSAEKTEDNGVVDGGRPFREK